MAKLITTGRLFELVDDVKAEFENCNHFYVDVYRSYDESVLLVNVSETDIRAIQALIHRGKIKYDEVYLKEYCDGDEQRLHFREDGCIVEDFNSGIFTINSELLMEIL